MGLRKPLILLATFAAVIAVNPFAWAQETQSSQPSLADAARKARQEQKSEPRSAKVYTDDDLANLKGQISIVGSAPAAAAPDNSAAAKAAGDQTQKEPVKDEAYWKRAFAQARRALADDQREADVLQREYGLKQMQYYPNPNVALQQQYSRKDLDDTLTTLNAKKADVDKDNQAISDLQDQLRASGGDPGWADAPTSNGQPGAESSGSDASQAPASQSDQPTQQNAPADSTPPASQPANQGGAPAASQPQTPGL